MLLYVIVTCFYSMIQTISSPRKIFSDELFKNYTTNM